MFCDGSNNLLRIRQECPVGRADGVEGGAGGALGIVLASLQELYYKFGLLCKESGDGACVVIGAGGGSFHDEPLGQNLMCSVTSL